jgi:hypothetical protein
MQPIARPQTAGIPHPSAAMTQQQQQQHQQHQHAQAMALSVAMANHGLPFPMPPFPGMPMLPPMMAMNAVEFAQQNPATQAAMAAVDASFKKMLGVHASLAPKKAFCTTVPNGLGVGAAPLGVRGLPTSKPRGNSRGNWTSEEVTHMFNEVAVAAWSVGDGGTFSLLSAFFVFVSC